MSEFVDECRQEWRRLGVPDPIANEMAADLAADLEEAEGEGGSLEDVLGNSAFDPRRFATAWAAARGVTNPPATPSRGRSPLALALTAFMGVLVIGAGLALMSGGGARSIAFAAPVAIHGIAAGHGPIHVVVPGSLRIAAPGLPGPPFIRTQIVGANVNPLALILLIVGIVGLGFAVHYWFPWSVSRRFRRRHEPPTPNWN